MEAQEGKAQALEAKVYCEKKYCNISKAWELGPKWSDGANRMQASWNCNSKWTNWSKATHGPYYSVMQRNCGRTLKIGAQ
jgi:hypothetical protein